MSLFSTQYPNNSRTVIGTPVIFNDDSILLCDTTLAPVVINLLDIPADYWNTPWKLYVVDKSNNASINNITINAGAGQTINGASSITLSVNGECALIRIIGNTQYVAQLSASGATIGGHIIQDEGVSLPQRPFLNFIGPGVVASDNPGTGKTDVTIGGGLITVTYAQLTTLANTNSLVVGSDYLITNAEFGSLPIIPTSVVVSAITTNKVSLQGEGIFFNADYQAVGDYSGIPTFNINKGVWTALLVTGLGDVCIWSNFMYLNLTGSNGFTPPDVDVVNWQVIPYSVTKGYILEVDAVEYQQSTNWIISRRDKRLNFVERAISPKPQNSLNCFSWGYDLVELNSITQGSIFEICNSVLTTTISKNTLINSTFISSGNVGSVARNTMINSVAGWTFSCNTFNENFITNSFAGVTSNNDGIISNNTISDSSVNWVINSNNISFNEFFNSQINVFDNSLNGFVRYNTISNSVLNVSILNDGVIEYNEVSTKSSLIVGTNNGTIGRFIPKGGSNVIEQSSTLQIETNNVAIYGNNFKNFSVVNVSTNNSEVSSNSWNQVTFTLSNNNFGVGKTTAFGTTFNATILTKQINGGIADFGINTIGYDLECTDPAIYDAGTNTLTIPISISTFFGFYQLKNAGGIVIDKIVNLSAQWETKFTNNAGLTTFNSVAVGAAVATEIVSSLGATAFAIVYRLNGTDSILLQLNGTLCGVTQTNIYA
jgi:hypothetical protein